MTAPDWPSLARRFEAADESDIYECVSDLAGAAGLPERIVQAMSPTISNAAALRLPDLLLGVVVACVPEGMACLFDDACVERPYVFASIRSVRSAHDFSVSAEAGSRPAAIGAAVCRAWDEVERAGKEVVG